MSGRLVAAAIAAALSTIVAMGGPAYGGDQLNASVSKQLKRMGYTDTTALTDRDTLAQLELLLNSGDGAPQRKAVERLLSQ